MMSFLGAAKKSWWSQGPPNSAFAGVRRGSRMPALVLEQK
jgi:hypothetical protein